MGINKLGYIQNNPLPIQLQYIPSFSSLGKFPEISVPTLSDTPIGTPEVVERELDYVAFEAAQVYI